MFEIIKVIQAREDDGFAGYASDSSSDIIPSYPSDGKSKFLFEDSEIGDIVSKLLPYIYVAAGLVLLLMLIFGGIELMTSGGNPDKMKAGYGRITSALIGFLIVFISYIVVQLVERIFGLEIL